MTRRLPLGLVLAVLLYAALRGLILWTGFETVALPMYELFPMGTLAELRLRGVDLPLAYFYDNAAGQILMGFLTVPVFALCGSSYLALKLLPAAIGLATLVLLWSFLRRHFSARAADVGAFLFAVGPPTLTKYSLINSGNHFENLFFSLLALTVTYRWFADPRKSRAGLFACGAASGFALFVFLGAIIPVGILVGMHLGLRGARRFVRDAAWVLPGFALGIAPLVAINLWTGARGLGFLDAKFGNENSGRGADVLARIGEYLGPELLRAPVFEPFLGLSREALSVLFLAAVVLAWIASLPSVLASLGAFARGLLRAPDAAEGAGIAAFQRAKLVPFVLYLPLAALAYGVSNFRLGGHTPPVEIAGYRYYLPALLFALIAVAVWSDRWLAQRGAARFAGCALLTAFAIPSLSSVAVVDFTFADTDVGRNLKGYNPPQIARVLVSARNDLSDAEIVRTVSTLPTLTIREPVVVALGFNLGVRACERARRQDGDAWTLDVAAFVAPWPAEWHPLLVRGLGHGLRWLVHVERLPIDGVEECAARLHPALTAAWADELWEGLASPGVALPLPWDSARILEENDDLLARRGGALPEFARGHGILCERLRWRRIPGERARLDAAAERARGSAYERSWRAGTSQIRVW